MKQREDTIRKWFSLWLDSREAELSDLFTEDAAYIESWGPEYYGREMIAAGSGTGTGAVRFCAGTFRNF